MDPFYEDYPGEVESSLHVFWDCKVATKTWLDLVQLQYRSNFFNLAFNVWIETNLS